MSGPVQVVRRSEKITVTIPPSDKATRIDIFAYKGNPRGPRSRDVCVSVLSESTIDVSKPVKHDLFHERRGEAEFEAMDQSNPG